MATDRDRASFEHWHIQRQRSRGYGAFLSDAEFVTRDESGRYRTLGLDDALEAWCAALASAPAAVHPLMAPEALCKTIGELLGAAMDQAVKNGANSVSMPDEYVALAAWLCETPAAPQPAEPAQPAPQAGAAEPALRPDIQAVLLELDVPVQGYLASHAGTFLKHAAMMPPEEYPVPLVRESDHRRACRKIAALVTHPTEQPSQDAAWQKIGDEVALILSDPDSELSRGAKRALDWIAARAAQAQGESTGGTPHG